MTDPIPGPPIVAVPGLGLSGSVPRRFLARVPRPSRVVELPGFGLPASRSAPRRADDLAQLLLDRALDGSTAERAVLIGHSASCQIVVEAAVRAPGRVAAVVLIGPTTDPRAVAWPRLLGRWLRTAVRERPGQVPQLLRDYHRTGLGAMARGMHAIKRHDIRAALVGVRVPVLVVRGPRDRICPQDWADAVAASTALGQVATLTAGAHMVPITRPAELAATIESFLVAVLVPHDDRPLRIVRPVGSPAGTAVGGSARGATRQDRGAPGPGDGPPRRHPGACGASTGSHPARVWWWRGTT